MQDSHLTNSIACHVTSHVLTGVEVVPCADDECWRHAVGNCGHHLGHLLLFADALTAPVTNLRPDGQQILNAIISTTSTALSQKTADVQLPPELRSFVILEMSGCC
jgi:hypothetical protein